MVTGLTKLGALAAALLGLAAATPGIAQTPSGGASAGGAVQGGSSSPGSGTGVPGSLQNGTSATGIGTSATPQVKQHRHRRRNRR